MEGGTKQDEWYEAWWIPLIVLEAIRIEYIFMKSEEKKWGFKLENFKKSQEKWKAFLIIFQCVQIQVKKKETIKKIWEAKADCKMRENFAS